MAIKVIVVFLVVCHVHWSLQFISGGGNCPGIMNCNFAFMFQPNNRLNKLLSGRLPPNTRDQILPKKTEKAKSGSVPIGNKDRNETNLVEEVETEPPTTDDVQPNDVLRQVFRSISNMDDVKLQRINEIENALDSVPDQRHDILAALKHTNRMNDIKKELQYKMQNLRSTSFGKSASLGKPKPSKDIFTMGSGDVKGNEMDHAQPLNDKFLRSGTGIMLQSEQPLNNIKVTGNFKKIQTGSNCSKDIGKCIHWARYYRNGELPGMGFRNSYDISKTHQPMALLGLKPSQGNELDREQAAPTQPLNDKFLRSGTGIMLQSEQPLNNIKVTGNFKKIQTGTNCSKDIGKCNFWARYFRNG